MSIAFSKLTRNELITDAADNTDGDIVARVSRDFMGSVFPKNVVLLDGDDGDTFPAALVDDTAYKVVSGFTQTVQFTLGQNNVILSDSPLGAVIFWNGSGTMLTGVDFGAGFLMNGVNIISFSDPILSLTNSGGNEGSSIFAANRCLFQAAVVGNLTSLGIKSISDSSVNGALTLTGGANVGGIDFRNVSWFAQVAGTTLLDIGSGVYPFIDLNNIGFEAVDGTNTILSGSGDANVGAGEVARVKDCSFINTDLVLSGITPEDIQWLFTGNTAPVTSNVRSSQIIGFAELVNNATVTTINTVGVLEPVNGTWIATSEERTSISTGAAPTGGVITYDAMQSGRRIKVDVSMSVQKVGGGNNKTYTFWLRHINGVTTTNFELGSVDLDAGQTARITSFEQIEFKTSDTVQLYVSNDTDTDDITFSDVKFRYGAF